MVRRSLSVLALTAALSISLSAALVFAPAAAAKDGGSSGGSGSGGSSGGSGGSSGGGSGSSGSSGSGSSGSGSSGSGPSGSNSGSGGGGSGGSGDGSSDDGGRGGSSQASRPASPSSASASTSGSDRSIWDMLGLGKDEGARSRKGKPDSPDRDGEDHEQARDAMLKGEAVPLARVLPVVGKAVAGPVLEVKVGRLPGGNMSYEVKVLDGDGAVRSVLVDARRNRVVGVR